VAGLLSLADAQAAVLARARPLSAESVPVERAAGRVLVERARAAVDLPPFDSSAMDGFAVRSADVPGRLDVVATIETGRASGRELARGEAIAIGTGGVVPAGADAVLPVEYVVRDGNTIETSQALGVGENVRPQGRDVHAGDVLLEAGVALTAARLGALAAAGAREVVCARRPRLAAAAESAGAAVTRLTPVADDEAAHRAALEQGLAGDVLVTSGGVSVGTQDLVRRVERELGVEEVFWRVAVKPGKPVSFGVRGRTLVFGLPGNPVSALVGFELFVRPALQALQGARDPGPRWLPGRLGVPVSRNGERDDLLRARAVAGAGGVELTPVSGQESHMIARAATADALVLVPRGQGALEAGAAVRYLELS
jgi:molybdopterin molybdotransferase